MRQFLVKPDRYLSICGHLNVCVAERRVAGAPDFMRGLRALFISDIHATARTRAGDIKGLADKINALSPDLLLLGGDYADEPDQALRLFEGLAPLRFPLGCYGVLGNNDREAWPELGALRAAMAKAGCKLLVNQRERIGINGGTLWIAGLDDYIYGNPRPGGLYPSQKSKDSYRILLYHEPCPVRPAPDLTLSGHTHGGQFNLLGFTPYSIGFERLYGRHIAPLAVAGWLDQDGARLLVSKGIGASRIQLRVGVRPEMELLCFE